MSEVNTSCINKRGYLIKTTSFFLFLQSRTGIQLIALCLTSKTPMRRAYTVVRNCIWPYISPSLLLIQMNG